MSIHATVAVPAQTRTLLKRVAEHVARAEGFEAGELSVVVVGTARMSRLHREHAGISGPTDVLTFDLSENPRELDAEIVLCADVARRANPGDPAAELALYLAHGLLHLAGYDDHSAAEFARMHAREDELLSEIGLGRVFSRG